MKVFWLLAMLGSQQLRPVVGNVEPGSLAAQAGIVINNARMHEAAGLIQTQVDLMMQDVNRLDERVNKLATHFSQVERDINDIKTSTRKITSRGDRISEIEVTGANSEPAQKATLKNTQKELLG